MTEKKKEGIREREREREWRRERKRGKGREGGTLHGAGNQIRRSRNQISPASLCSVRPDRKDEK